MSPLQPPTFRVTEHAAGRARPRQCIVNGTHARVGVARGFCMGSRGSPSLCSSLLADPRLTHSHTQVLLRSRGSVEVSTAQLLQFLYQHPALPSPARTPVYPRGFGLLSGLLSGLHAPSESISSPSHPDPDRSQLCPNQLEPRYYKQDALWRRPPSHQPTAYSSCSLPGLSSIFTHQPLRQLKKKQTAQICPPSPCARPPSLAFLFRLHRANIAHCAPLPHPQYLVSRPIFYLAP
ncbi:hypothetical protein F4808DRAFT_131871 [Astrocystis sublimbata]|nr:hypothetical protein F4808DRAFT_131871 [Astrocystis sublimbata]